MIVLDTNVLSELMRAQPEPSVRAWLQRVLPEDLFTTSVNEAEVLGGITVMPAGRRRVGMEAAASSMFSDDFAGRVLPFDRVAARHYADILSSRQKSGRRIEALDAMIAAITRAHGATLATRNIKDFEECGIVLDDPWQDGG